MVTTNNKLFALTVGQVLHWLSPSFSSDSPNFLHWRGEHPDETGTSERVIAPEPQIVRVSLY